MSFQLASWVRATVLLAFDFIITTNRRYGFFFFHKKYGNIVTTNSFISKLPHCSISPDGRIFPSHFITLNAYSRHTGSFIKCWCRTSPPWLKYFPVKQRVHASALPLNPIRRRCWPARTLDEHFVTVEIYVVIFNFDYMPLILIERFSVRCCKLPDCMEIMYNKMKTKRMAV